MIGMNGQLGGQIQILSSYLIVDSRRISERMPKGVIEFNVRTETPRVDSMAKNTQVLLWLAAKITM